MDIKTLNNVLDKIPIGKKIIILILVIASLFLIINIQIIKPKVQQTNQLTAELAALTEKYNKNQRLLNDIDLLEKEFNQVQKNFMEIQAQLPTKKEIPNLLTKISDLANFVNVEFLLFKPLPENKADFYNEVPIDIQMRGCYHNIVKFFDFISKLPRIVNITDVSMNKPQLIDREVVIHTNCRATTYRFAENNEEKQDDKKKKKKK